MFKKRFYLTLILLITVSLAYSLLNLSGKQNVRRIDLGEIQNDQIREASGIAASRKNTGVLWVHNDSGDGNRIFAINRQGRNLGTYHIDKAYARDWEDIAIGPGSDQGDYIYIGDIGDNDAGYEIKTIYRIKEPIVEDRQSAVDSILTDVEILSFIYPDGRRDAEALMVDPVSGDIYIISKRELGVHIYLAAYPQAVDTIFTLTHAGILDLTYITAGDISPDGSGIILKSYNQVYYWHRSGDLKIPDILQTKPRFLDYIPEPQGEAITWDPTGNGYYTVSEELQGIPARLYYYPFPASQNQVKRYE